MNSALRLFHVLIICLPIASFVQDEKWVEAEGLASMLEMGQQQARISALNQARADAVRQVAGVNLKSEMFRTLTEGSRGKEGAVVQDFFAAVNRDVAYGHVVKEEILSEGPVTFATLAGQPPQLYYQVKIRALVAREEGEPDPTFDLRVRTNKSLYEENDKMTIDLTATQDCYVYVFNLLANDSLTVLFPNLYFQDNRLPADSTLRMPPPGFSFEVNLLPGFQRAQELIYVVATKQRFSFAPEWKDKEEGFRTAATRAFAAIELPRWLANIPPDQRTDRVVAYEVYRGGN